MSESIVVSEANISILLLIWSIVKPGAHPSPVQTPVTASRPIIILETVMEGESEHLGGIVVATIVPWVCGAKSCVGLLCQAPGSGKAQP